jgi:hypothetical protein
MGELNMDGRPKEELRPILQRRNPLLKSLNDYRLFNGQEELQWENLPLPIPEVALIPRGISVGDRGKDFKLADQWRVNRPREAGPLTQMTYQIFTMENKPIGEPEVIQAPNEITLAQLVTFFILPTGIQLDVGSVFYWNLLRIEDKSMKDKTVWQVEEIPALIPVGFNLRVKCSSLRDGAVKVMAHAHYGSAHMAFAMMPNDTVGKLKARAIEWMNQSDHGMNWTIDRPDAEVIDFEWDYEIIESVHEAPVRIFIKQLELEVLPSESWMTVSDRLVKRWRLAKGSLLRIFPVYGNVEDQDDEDHSYTINWEAEGRYWYDVIYDPSRDPKSLSKEIVLVDASNRTDTFVVPADSNIHQVRDRWAAFIEVPQDVRMSMSSSNGHEFFWGLESDKDPISFTFRAVNMHGNACVFDGSHTFVAEQLSRCLGVKTPPFETCQLEPRRGHSPKITYTGGTPLLSHRLLRQHRLAWNLAGNLLYAPEVSTWWLPYNKVAIMRYVHAINTDIPENPEDAEFPDEPWPEDVIIRIKSHPGQPAPAGPTSVGGTGGSSASGVPIGWAGPALGSAPAISAAASGLSGYISVNQARTVEGQAELPPDEGLQQFRGLTQKDSLVHALISWATLESYPLRIGVSLPVLNPALEDGEEVFHEAQLWEETEEEWIITDNHAVSVYNWLMQRLAARSSGQALPEGMPSSVDTMTVQT